MFKTLSSIFDVVKSINAQAFPPQSGAVKAALALEILAAVEPELPAWAQKVVDAIVKAFNRAGVFTTSKQPDGQ